MRRRCVGNIPGERVCTTLVVRCSSNEDRDECSSFVRESFRDAFHQKYIPKLSYSRKERECDHDARRFEGDCNPGSTAGRGLNPAGGALGGG
ncbi:hypothetical protein F511_08861 [Dorcoceras hygrometricum]|uniref:Uncharacterized protein n=1 Tax=Dorcoceras hygrometricum TaxID=472368 RepID=A0A2Z7AM45_9LAMI|nr:hypothetical protein F511_08861 [Dorcoceras hygrometricum]